MVVQRLLFEDELLKIKLLWLFIGDALLECWVWGQDELFKCELLLSFFGLKDGSHG